MADDDQLALLGGQAAQQAAEGLLGVAVQAGEGLVQQVNVCPLSHRPGQESALLLAAGERGNLPVGKVCQARGGQGGLDDPAVFPAERPPRAQRRVAAHLGQAAHR